MKSQYRLQVFLATTLLISMIPFAAAQPGAKPLIALFAYNQGACRDEAFHRGLRELGYVEGSNFDFICGHAGGKYKNMDAAAERLVSTKPDVIVVFGHAPTTSVQRATHNIPIITLCSGDPVGSGFAKSLAHPGLNITGVTDFTFELNLKRLELLKSVMPSLQHLAVLMNVGLPTDLSSIFMRDTNAAAKTLGFDVKLVKFTNLEDLDAAYEKMSRAGTQAILIAPMQEVPAETQRLVELSRQHHLPTVSMRKSYTNAGELMSYGVDFASLRYRTAYFVDRVLKGAKPGDLPIEQPTRFELYINLNTAKQLGLQIPESVLLRADKVIE